eukprot:4855732-Prymnesium_polylepis.1
MEEKEAHVGERGLSALPECAEAVRFVERAWHAVDDVLSARERAQARGEPISAQAEAGEAAAAAATAT